MMTVPALFAGNRKAAYAWRRRAWVLSPRSTPRPAAAPTTGKLRRPRGYLRLQSALPTRRIAGANSNRAAGGGAAFVDRLLHFQP